MSQALLPVAVTPSAINPQKNLNADNSEFHATLKQQAQMLGAQSPGASPYMLRLVLVLSGVHTSRGATIENSSKMPGLHAVVECM